MEKSNIANRMKLYENLESGRYFIPLLPIIARMDGRSFHSFTKHMDRPYDIKMMQCMQNTTKELVKETNALIGYTQSDEITLVWLSTNIKSQVFFDGKIQKMTSHLSALTTLHFYKNIQQLYPEYVNRFPTFDARTWQVPNRQEAVNCLIWRQQDAVRNSINMLGQTYFSHKQLQGRTTSRVKEMLFDKGIIWEHTPYNFKNGTFFKKHSHVRQFTSEELERLPPKHEAHVNPNLMIERTYIDEIKYPILTTIANLPDVIFDNAEIVLK